MTKKIEALRYELEKVSEYAVMQGIQHKEVCELAGISYSYLMQINAGTNASTGRKKTLKTIQNLINCYRQLTVKKERLLAELKVNL